MRPWLYSLVFVLLPAGAWAGSAVSMKEISASKKLTPQECEDQLGREGVCYQDARIEYPVLHDVPNAKILNAKFKEDAFMDTGDLDDWKPYKVAPKYPHGAYVASYLQYTMIRFENASLLSLEFSIAIPGGAHDQAGMYNSIIDKAKGSIVTIQDIFGPHLCGAIEYSNAGLSKELEEKQDWLRCGQEDYAANNFSVRPDGVYFTYYVYPMTSEIEVKLPKEYVVHPEILKLYR